VTLESARLILQPPLFFGDMLQISAHEFWLQVLDCFDHVLECERGCYVSRTNGWTMCREAAEEFDDDVVVEMLFLFGRGEKLAAVSDKLNMICGGAA
jgi:hypothetical protein